MHGIMHIYKVFKQRSCDQLANHMHLYKVLYLFFSSISSYHLLFLYNIPFKVFYMLYIYQVVNEIKNKPLKVMTLKAAWSYFSIK